MPPPPALFRHTELPFLRNLSSVTHAADVASDPKYEANVLKVNPPPLMHFFCLPQ